MLPALLLALMTPAQSAAATTTSVVSSGPVTIWPRGSTGRISLCSRRRPGPADGSWTPRWRDVARVETLLPHAMREWRVATGNVSPYNAPRFEDGDWEKRFRRNYFGLTRGGRKLLYIDFAPRAHRDGFSVCDGGPAYFGIELDVRAMKVLSYEENGVA